MYILSRDRLNMDLDRSCLDLMIRLLELDQDQGAGAVTDSPAQFSAKEIAKMKEKIRKLCDTVHNKHLDLQNITVHKLLTELQRSDCIWISESLTDAALSPFPHVDGSSSDGNVAVPYF